MELAPPCWFWLFGLRSESEKGRLATGTTGTLGRLVLEAFYTVAASSSVRAGFIWCFTNGDPTH